MLALLLSFSNNILDAVKSFSIILTDPENVTGLPESLLKMTAEAASLHISQNEQNSNTSTENLQSDTQIKLVLTVVILVNFYVLLPFLLFNCSGEKIIIK